VHSGWFRPKRAYHAATCNHQPEAIDVGIG
jgi:hypothetical protein